MVQGSVYLTRVPDYFKNREAYKPVNEKELKAFIPGTICDITVKVGDEVQKGDCLMILEAMKMNNEVKALTSGKVKSIHVAEGIMVRKNQLILEFE